VSTHRTVLVAALAVLLAALPAGATTPSRAHDAAAVSPASGPSGEPREPCASAPFPDVPASHPACADIEWLTESGIAGGYADGTYRPTTPVSRQAIATMLHRYSAVPTVACVAAPFPDVPVTHPACSAITWLADSGIAGGYADGTFRPTAPVSRQSVATLLHRFSTQAAARDACSVAPFPDVPVGNVACSDIAWLTEHGIASGYADGTFRPANAVSRQAVASFLHRYDVEIVGDGFVDPDWFAGRQDEYLAYATEQLSEGSALNVIAHLERERRDPSFEFDASVVTPDDFASSWNRIDNYLDTADFDLLYLMNLWYGYGDELHPDLRSRIEEEILDFKYWYTDPSPPGVIDERWYWSENHIVIFHVLEYLAGQAFPDETFTITGMTGAEHQARAAAWIDEWLEQKVAYGFSEWHSDVYYQKDVTPLLTLVEYADDEALAGRAAMVLDLVLYDLAIHTLDGNNGATHGRSYMKDKSRAPDQDVFGTVKLLFDATSEPWTSRGEPGATLLARAERYRLPEAVRLAGVSPGPMIDRERMGVPIDLEQVPQPGTLPDPPYGIAYDDPENIPFWWERGALTAWPVTPLTLDTIVQYDLWETEAFSQFLALRDIVTNPDGSINYELAKSLAYQLRHMINIGLLDEVNTYTYRTDDVMLSSAQDYRPGAFGNQYHAWQATLGSRAAVFTTHPANEPRAGTSWVDGDMYWTGTGTMPRSAQQGSAAIHVYAPAYENPPDGLLESFQFLDYTHAYFPTEEFDEVVRSGHWTFGRHDGGYVALWSWRLPDWRLHDPGVVFTNGLTQAFDLVAPGGPDNVWAVEVADANDWASFAAFRAAYEGSSPVVTELPPGAGEGPYGGFDVTWTSPSQGELSFGSQGPLTVDGVEVAIDGYPRMDNPWTQTAFGSDQVGIDIGRARLDLDFATWTRTTDARPW
jgi:hypothetical protein